MAGATAKPPSTRSADTARSTDWCAGWTGPCSHTTPNQVTLSCAVRPQPGYEWQLDLQITYTLDGTGLTVTFIAVNTDSEPAPFGVGFHPYLTLGTATVDDLELTVPATAFLDPGGPADPPSMTPVASTPRDFILPRRIGSLELDTAFGDLVYGGDGRAVSRLDDPDKGRWVELWVDEGYRYLMVYTADQVTRPERRRAAVAIEPMTCPPDALRSWGRPDRAAPRCVLARNLGFADERADRLLTLSRPR